MTVLNERKIRASRQVLLICEDQQQTLFHLSIAQYPMKFLLRLVDSFPVLTINNENEALCSGVVMSPERPNLVLSSDIPYIEFHILVRNRFYIETDYKTQLSARLYDKQRHSTYPSEWWSQIGLTSVCREWLHETISVTNNVERQTHSLVFPAASRPNINNRISLLPKILPRTRKCDDVTINFQPTLA